MDDPTPGGRHDGMDPAEDARTPDAPRAHGGVRDTAHPEFHDAGVQAIPSPGDQLVADPRALVVDDLEMRALGAHDDADELAAHDAPAETPRRA